MPLAFSEICNLFTRLEDIEQHEPPILLPTERRARCQAVTESWFKSHRPAIDKLALGEAVSLLSTLLPERRTDRVYGIKSAALCRILGRCLGLSAARAHELEGYKRRGGDLGSCLERVLRSGGPPAQPSVRLSEIDDLLNELASMCHFSDASITSSVSKNARDSLFSSVFHRLDSTQAKWLVRLLLKDLAPIQIQEASVLQCFHFLLPDLLRFQSTFAAALTLLRGPLKEFPPLPDPRSRRLHRQSAALLLEPAVGIKIGRPTFMKGRSIDDCVKLCGDRKWVLERKYDGEYCEVHIDMSRSSEPTECIQLFSKSGKDSTDDRKNIHQTLVDCLRLECPQRQIKQRAIILGEIVVTSSTTARILPFEKVRQHVTRSGVFLGTKEDSFPSLSDSLAIVFFDLLLLDDDILMRKPLEERRRRLRGVYSKIPARAIGAEWKIVDFRDADNAKRTLIQQFAASIAERCEGLILKPCGEPYFNLNDDTCDGLKSYIKLKKDYLAGMGDEADMAVVGASHDGQQALKCLMAHPRWTTFYLGCLVNKSELGRVDVRPRFRIVATIHAQHCIPHAILEAANALGTFCARAHSQGTLDPAFDIMSAPSAMDTVFGNPLVFEVLGSGFEKSSDSSIFMLRHPRVRKLHQDRTWRDCVSLQELQKQAAEARDVPIRGESLETLKLIERLEAKCQKRHGRKQTSSQGSKAAVASVGSCRRYLHCSPGSQQLMQTRLKRARFDESIDNTTSIRTTQVTRERVRGLIGKPEKHPPFKRLRLEAVSGDATTRTVSAPFADITNTAPERPSTMLRVEPTRNENKASSQQSSPLKRIAECCAKSSCFLRESVIYASPCIVNTPYINKDLLACHDVTIIAALIHWDRDSGAHGSRGEIVSESQAFKGMRKIVLVERMRKVATSETISTILNLNAGCWRECVEVWDWRVLESELCRSHEGMADAQKAMHFVGATQFDWAENRAVFVAADAL